MVRVGFVWLELGWVEIYAHVFFDNGLRHIFFVNIINVSKHITAPCRIAYHYVVESCIARLFFFAPYVAHTMVYFILILS